MANKTLFKYIGATAVGVTLVVAPACTDTWDDHYDDLGTAASLTLWEQIKSDPNLSRFAEIAETAKYYKDESHPVPGYTFKDILSSAQVNTVWVPDNDAISEAEFERLKDMRDNDGYNLQTQFLTNHIARWRWRLTNAEKDTLYMSNSKEVVFDKGARTIYGVELGKANIEATNGTLHTVKGIIPFRYNIYQYLKFSGEVKRMQEFVLANDTLYFSESSSIEGLPDENGNPTYVDSVYFLTNMLTGYTADDASSLTDNLITSRKGIAGSFNNEGAEYIMMVPTDAAYDAAYQMLSPRYEYAPLYIDREKSTSITSPEMTRAIANTDSLRDENVRYDIAAPLLLYLDNQGRIGGEDGAPWVMDDFIATKGEGGEYLLNTRGDTLRSTDTWDKSEFFNGTPIEMSNGYAILSDKWNMPREYYSPDVDIKMGYGCIYTEAETFKGVLSYKSFPNNSYYEIGSRYGKISKDYFYLLKGEGAADNPKCDVKLQADYSLAYNTNAYVQKGKYDVYIIMVPYWYSMISDAGEIDSCYFDSAYVDSIANTQKVKMKTQIYYDNGTKKGASSKTFTVEYIPTKVDTVLCIPDMEFPYSYQNMLHSYPLLHIEASPTTADTKKGYIRQICIDRIILKSKEDGSVVTVDPS